MAFVANLRFFLTIDLSGVQSRNCILILIPSVESCQQLAVEMSMSRFYKYLVLKPKVLAIPTPWQKGFSENSNAVEHPKSRRVSKN
jgi:hypothetical protein